MNLFPDRSLKPSRPTSWFKLISISPVQPSRSLQSIVPDPSVYATHSFRSGGASRAANSGVSDRIFQRHGRWKNVAAKGG